MSRVLSTEQARSAVTALQSVISGGLTEQIARLDAQGRTLSQPEVWDGQLAAQFRGTTWPQTKRALDAAVVELEALREQLSRITANIMAAGGNA